MVIHNTLFRAIRSATLRGRDKPFYHPPHHSARYLSGQKAAFGFALIGGFFAGPALAVTPSTDAIPETSYSVSVSPEVALANKGLPDPVADAFQSSTAYYRQECHLFGNETMIPADCDYLALNLGHLDEAERKHFTMGLLGIGVDTRYLLITRPGEIRKREIYLLDDLDIDYLVEQLEHDLGQSAEQNPSRRVKRALAEENGNVMEFVLHRRFTVEREGDGNATLKYKVRYYSKSPFYSRSGDKDKYVEVVLAEGSGIDMGLENDWSSIYYRWNHNSSTSYVYNEYLDAVNVDILVHDAEKLKSGQIYFNDLYPRMQDQVDSKIEKETSTSIKLGLGFSAKIPLKDIEYTFRDKYTITNKKEFSLVTDTKSDGYSIRYVNNRYGSAVPAEQGFCDLGTADGWCWDYDDKYGEPWDFDKLKQNNPLAVSGMRPDFVAKVAAKPEVEGTSDISVKTTVQGLALFGHNRWIIGRRYASGSQLWKEKTSFDPDWQENRDFEKLAYHDEFTLSVDWNSPWFLGADAVTIKSTYLSQDSAQCLTVGEDKQLSFTSCVEGATSQSFVYDQEQRYRSVKFLDHCLDSAGGQLTLSNQCHADYAPNSQVWYWQEPNSFANDVLYTVNHDRTINAIDASAGASDAKPAIVTLDDTAEKPVGVLYTSRFTDFSTVRP